MMNASSQNSTQPDILAAMPVFVLTVILSGYNNDPIKEDILEIHEVP